MPPEPRVIVIGPTPPPLHGVSVSTELLLASLGQGVACHLDTRDERPVDTIGRFELENVRLGLKHAAQLIGLLRRNPGADVYLPISQGSGGFLRDSLFIGAATAAGRRVYVHLHGGSFAEFHRTSGPVMRSVIARVLRPVHEAWVLTPSLADAFDGLIPRERVRIVENAVADPGPLVRRAPAAEGFNVLYMANLFPTKGCFELTRALRELGERAAGWQVRFAGSAAPEVEWRLREEAAELSRAGVSVELAGVVSGEAKRDALGWADLFAFPTHYPQEGQPLVLLEAMAAGLPILSTRHAGIPDTVRDDSEGVLVEPHDTEALAGALALLASDADLRARLGRNGRARYEERYTPARLAREVQAVWSAAA